MVSSQRLLSLVVVLLVGVMCAVTLATSGRSYAARDSVAASIDDAGFRSVIVEAAPGSGLTTSFLGALSHSTNVESLIGFGESTTAWNAALPAGNRLALRTAYLSSASFSELTTDGAYVSDRAAIELGMSTPSGALQTENDTFVDVIGSITVPAQLAYLEPLVLYPAEKNGNEELSNVVIVVDQPQHVNAVIGLVSSLVIDLERDGITIRASQDFASLQEVIDGELTGNAQVLTATVFSIAAALVAITLFAVATFRRRDYGRRRALGASIPLLVIIQLAYVFVLSTFGALIGTFVTTQLMRFLSLPVPQPLFLGALVWTAILVSVVFSVIPALYASRRDPATELRVP